MIQQRLFSLMKDLLPRSVSFRLRYAKSEIVDTEMHALKKIAACLGGKDQYAIDVGANWGIYSRALSKKFDQVLCIEPNPACAQYLRSVLAVNCTVIDAAASNKDEYRNLRVPVSANTAETTRGTISERNTFDDLDVVTVQENRVHCIRLDETATGLVTGPGRVALIKVDVEGHELEAVQGAEGILKRHKPVLFVELEERHGTRTAELLSTAPCARGLFVALRCVARGSRSLRRSSLGPPRTSTSSASVPPTTQSTRSYWRSSRAPDRLPWPQRRRLCFAPTQSAPTAPSLRRSSTSTRETTCGRRRFFAVRPLLIGPNKRSSRCDRLRRSILLAEAHDSRLASPQRCPAAPTHRPDPAFCAQPPSGRCADLASCRSP